MSNVDWNMKIDLPPIRNYRQGENLTHEAIDNWIVITSLVRPSASQPEKKRERLNRLFGKDNWQQGWLFKGKVLDRPDAIALYEEAYYQFFRDNPDITEWLCKTTADVWDNDPSNINSGFDYALQETKAAHLQDISIRRAIVRLGRSLQGNRLLEVHDEGSEGFHINPGQIPFHEPEEILEYPVSDWWLQKSIEAFWQHNKVILVRPVKISTLAHVDSTEIRSLNSEIVLVPDPENNRIFTARELKNA